MANLGFRPLHDKVLIKRDDGITETPSGILIPEIAKDKPKTGTVIAVGSGTINEESGMLEPLSVKVGDKVFFTAYAGTEVKINEEAYIIMPESEILAVLE